ncbi:MAG: kelch motif-containing protein [Gammaproteobacteria bacterium]|nr:kelch motif-containing protein [Gammaproteobacteria bacterium]
MTQLSLSTRLFPLLMVFLALFALTMQGCFHSSGSSGGGPSPAAPVDRWTWMSGSNIITQVGIYGIKGVADAVNVPGARSAAMSKADANSNLWLFGGNGVDREENEGFLNDLWHWDGTRWTWISGNDVVEQFGNYGTKDVAAATNVPGARSSGVTWVDASNNFWLFGGVGFDSAGMEGTLNDLWRWDGSNWTWVSGSNLVNQSGDYGVKGTPIGSNIPGAREKAVSWSDSSGNLWLFGGRGYDGNGDWARLNDLWRWDVTNAEWVWVSGNDVVGEFGVYGTKGTAVDTNMPGARGDSVAWIDTNDDFWLWGGVGRDGVGTFGNLNDLWHWDGSNWTWVSGSDVVDQSGSYGTKGNADATNIPGARRSPVSWVDTRGIFWLFGGWGYDSTGTPSYLNDLWRWDGDNWVWVSGSDVVDQFGIYGIKGTADATNVPGARERFISWTDTAGNLWFFGGEGYDSTGGFDTLNDMWRYEP